MKKILCLLFLVPVIASSQDYDILIQHGKIIDGTGNSWYYGDIAVKNGKIAAIGKLNTARAQKIISAKGLIVSPGFIDVHGHIESGIFENPAAGNYIYDGVTTVITGNCGRSDEDLKKFFWRIDSMQPAINVASLVGHNTVRRLAMGLNNRLATLDEQKKMEALVAEAMKAGAVGLSTGLQYVPGMYSNEAEVIGLAKSAAVFGGVYASHIRDEENEVHTAVNEAINIGKGANIPVEISHFKVSGRSNWNRSRETLNMVESARKEGYDVTIDQYPYTASSTNLGICLPGWALSGGQDSLKARIGDPALRKKIISEMLEIQKNYKYKNYGYAFVAYHEADTTLNGKNISQINQLKGRKEKINMEAETILDMLAAGGAQMVYHSMNEEDVRYFMKYPFNMIGADGGVPVPGRGMPHPRAYGTNARVLAKYVREEKLVTLEEMIRRMTSLAAQKFRLLDRGMLKEGMAADIVVFDEVQVKDNATFEKPHQFSSGFKYVLVNGKIALENEKQTSLKSGMSLKGPGTIK